jgi:hypothetical protein
VHPLTIGRTFFSTGTRHRDIPWAPDATAPLRSPLGLVSGSQRHLRSSFRGHLPSPCTIHYSLTVAVHRNRTVDDHQCRNLIGDLPRRWVSSSSSPDCRILIQVLRIEAIPKWYGPFRACHVTAPVSTPVKHFQIWF